MSKKKRFWDLLSQAPLIVGFLALSRIVSYFVIMLLRWIEELMGADGGMLHTVLVGVDVALGICLCVFATFIYIIYNFKCIYSFHYTLFIRIYYW